MRETNPPFRRRSAALVVGREPCKGGLQRGRDLAGDRDLLDGVRESAAIEDRDLLRLDAVGGVLRCLLASAHQEEAIFGRAGVMHEPRRTGVTSARLTFAKARNDALIRAIGVKRRPQCTGDSRAQPSVVPDSTCRSGRPGAPAGERRALRNRIPGPDPGDGRSDAPLRDCTRPEAGHSSTDDKHAPL